MLKRIIALKAKENLMAAQEKVINPLHALHAPLTTLTNRTL